MAIAALSGACDRAPEPSGQWSPNDHDPVEQQAAPQGSAKLSLAQQLVASAWTQTCAQCHGLGGRGDGPNGALVKAPDLTNPEWQAKVTDQEIADRIRHGKGLMPPNELPDSTVQGLVQLVRAIKGK